MAELSKDSTDWLALSRAIRFALGALVLGISYFNIRLALALGNIEAILKDMLNIQELEGLTFFSIRFKTELAVIAIAIPLVAVASFFLKSPIKSVYMMGACVLAIFAELICLIHAALGPFIGVTWGMSGAA